MLRRPFSSRLIFDWETSSRSATSSAVMPLSSRSRRSSWPSRRRLTVGLTLDATGRAPPAAGLYLPLCVSAVEQTATKVLSTAGKQRICAGYTPVRGSGRYLAGKSACMCGRDRSWCEACIEGLHMRPRGAVGPCRRPDVRSHRPARASGSRTGSWGLRCGAGGAGPAVPVRACRGTAAQWATARAMELWRGCIGTPRAGSGADLTPAVAGRPAGAGLRRG